MRSLSTCWRAIVEGRAAMLWGLLVPLGLWGQDPRPGLDGMPGETSFPTRSQEEYVEVIDTAGVYYFFADNPFEETRYSDSLLNDYFHQYDPVRNRRLDYAHLGYLGSAHQPIVYEARERMGVDIGFHQYDLYLTRAADLPFYRLNKAFTNLAYYQGSEQSDSYFKGQFSRNFAGGINLSLDYKRISQLGDLNRYPREDARNTALSFGLSYESPNRRYRAFAAYAFNTIEQEDNGGIESVPEDDIQFGSPNSAEIFLEAAETRHLHRELTYTHHYILPRDTLEFDPQKRAYALRHQFIY
ncbi:MAG: putative porin, partial [Saprospiraceae bacterium]|nr:putative porin [Saprospiraceae bacterium]